MAKLRGTIFLFLLALIYAGSSLASDIILRQAKVEFQQGNAVLKGRLKGSETIDYTFRAAEGQRLSVSLVSRNLSTYFNVLPPSTEEAIFIGSSNGNQFSGALARDGEYKIRVYLMRNAARRNEKTEYSLSVSLSANEDTASAKNASAVSTGFSRTIELQGIRFQVTCANDGSLNQLKIATNGLAIDNTPITRRIDGQVIGAEVADINVDGSPEIYVYIQSAGSGSYGSVVAFSANKRKSLSEIVMPDISADKKMSRGYQGHDEFAVVENVLARRFPIYGDADTNARPSGKIRQLQYKLVKGEATWRLRVDRVVEY
jgi:hypothetical protein